MARKKREQFNFDAAMRLMRKHDPQLQGDGFGMLQAHAREYVEQLLAEFRVETRHGLRCWLLELIGDAKSPQALPLLVEMLHSDDESLHGWAIRGLKELNIKEARQALWEAGEHAHNDTRKR